MFRKYLAKRQDIRAYKKNLHAYEVDGSIVVFHGLEDNLVEKVRESLDEFEFCAAPGGGPIIDAGYGSVPRTPYTAFRTPRMGWRLYDEALPASKIMPQR